jgi:hypothetical protein
MNNPEGMTICHREYIADITGSALFSIAAGYPINPGLESSFPWLSQIANNFEEYSFKGLVFEFVPSSGSSVGGPSAALGRLVYATSYDVADPAFTSKQQMESYEFSTACVPFDAMIHPVECAPRSNVLGRLYTRSAAVPSGSDSRFYDLGKFQYATQGMQTAYVIGELWVSYHVSFYRPRIAASGDLGFTHLYNKTAGATTAAAPFSAGGIVAYSPSNTLSSVVIDASTSTKSFYLTQVGTYAVSMQWVGTAIAAAPALTLGANVTSLVSLQQFATPSITYFLVSGLAACITFIVSVLQPGTGATNIVTVSGLTAMATGDCDIFVTGLPLAVGGAAGLA